ncbi:MAG: hypothetical protein Q7U75_15750, partial [Desulfobacterales bacterium]|nr:hypothetical protein [Desulfobacterales bacterium]
LIWEERALKLYAKPAASGRIEQNACGGETGYAYMLQEVLAVERQHPEFLIRPSDGSGTALGFGRTPPPGYTYRGPVVTVNALRQRCLGLTLEMLEQAIMTGQLHPYNLLRGRAEENGEPSAEIMNPDSWKTDPGLLARELYLAKRIVFLKRDVEEFMQWFPHIASPKDVPADIPPAKAVAILRAVGIKDNAALADELDKRFQGPARLSNLALGDLLAREGDIKSVDANRKRGKRARKRNE